MSAVAGILVYEKTASGVHCCDAGVFLVTICFMVVFVHDLYEKKLAVCVYYTNFGLAIHIYFF